jgi:hypothetical protein
MYYVERRINGILHYQTIPDGEWKPVLPSKLNEKLFETEIKYLRVCNELFTVKNDLHEIRLKLDSIFGIGDK